MILERLSQLRLGKRFIISVPFVWLLIFFVVPFLILVVAPVVLANGGTGLVKIVLLRLFKRLGFDISPTTGTANGNGNPWLSPWRQHELIVRALHRVRFPLHDHCRKVLGWSNAQVLMRFVLIQSFLAPILMMLLVKVR